MDEGRLMRRLSCYETLKQLDERYNSKRSEWIKAQENGDPNALEILDDVLKLSEEMLALETEESQKIYRRMRHRSDLMTMTETKQD